MKALNKKAFPKKEAAIMHLTKKHGLKADQLKLAKEHRTRWMFYVVPSAEAVELQPWNDFVAEYRKNNPGMSYKDALSSAAPLYQALKEAAEDQKAA